MADIVEDRDVEFEEGECSSSDGEQIDFTSLSSAPFIHNKDINSQTTAYRSRIPQIVINSDESNDGSDDDCPSAWKKTCSPFNKSHANGEKTADVPFVNPLLSSKMGINSATGNSQRRKNNVWGSVLTEQVLSQEVKLFGVDNEVVLAANRDVESYDFTKAKEDERPDLDIDPDEVDNSRDDIFDEVVDLEKEVRKHESRKRKRHAKERLGKRSYNKQKRRTLEATASDDVSDVVAAITKGLSESKVQLFTRIVETIGNDLAIKLFYMTEDVEECGGMMTNDGYRRRTPGGVYIQLLKNDTSLSSEIIDSIFKEEQQKWKETLKDQRKIKKAARKGRKRPMRREMDIDRSETPAPAEDLEVLNAVDSNSEFENTDLPERPATPEPKDDSSDGQDDNVDEDEEDDTDIAVVIAKAKAAILKKQRELANKIVTDSAKLHGESSMQSFTGSGDGSEGSLKDNEMTDDGSCKALMSKVSNHGLISADRLSADVEIGDMEDV